MFPAEGFSEVVIVSWLGSSNSKLTWGGFKTATTEFSSDSLWLSHQAMTSTCTYSQLCRDNPVSWFVQCHISFRLFAFVTCHFYLIDVFLQVITLSGIWTHDHWIPFRRSNPLKYHTEFNSQSQKIFNSYSTFAVCSVSHFILTVLLGQSPRLFSPSFL